MEKFLDKSDIKPDSVAIDNNTPNNNLDVNELFYLEDQAFGSVYNELDTLDIKISKVIEEIEHVKDRLENLHIKPEDDEKYSKLKKELSKLEAKKMDSINKN